MRYHLESDVRTLTLSLLGYDAAWTSTDQIPLRAVLGGAITRLGWIDPTDGGRSSRYEAAFAGTWRGTEAETRANVYATRYRLNLFSNFTYFLDDPVNGDQFEQADDRWTAGGSIVREWREAEGEEPRRRTVGLQVRSDLIGEVALKRTAARARLSNVRSDRVRVHSIGLFAECERKWTDRVRVTAGARGDYYNFDVRSDLAANSGTRQATIVSPKINIAFTAPENVEWYVSAGTGFHSNDARGTTITTDPASGDSAARVDPLVRSRGAEVGLRVAVMGSLASTVSLFVLDAASEVLFVGDAGNTEASGETRRIGIEITSVYQPVSWAALDLDASLTRGRFRDAGPEGDRIPGAIGSMMSAGAALGRGERFFGSLRVRYAGPRYLTQDGAVRGGESLLGHARIGFRHRNWEAFIEVLNLFDRDDNDIEYFYGSRLPGEPAEGIADVHFHPMEPRTVRAAFTARF